jgi:biotin carboxyl carrier protein
VPERVIAEMVGNVWKVLVAQGDPVRDGDVVVILESMKMEIPIAATVSGTVSQVAVAEGEIVQEGDLLVAID